MLERVVVFFLLIGLSLPPAIGVSFSADATPRVLKPLTLKICFTQRAFLGVNPQDVEAALKNFSRAVGRRYGYDLEPTILRIESAHDLGAFSAAERPNLIILDSWSYLDFRDAEWFEPLFIGAEQGLVAHSYLLLARREETIQTLSDLRGKTLNLLATANANLGDHWLDALLQDQNLGQPETFFSDLTFCTDPMKALLPVFFGKKDAVLIDSEKVDLMMELNPQLRNLRTLAASAPLVNAVIGFNHEGWSTKQLRPDLIKALTELHLDQAGQQILTLFKVDQMVPFDPPQLDSLIQLRDALGGCPRIEEPAAKPSDRSIFPYVFDK
jgi:ABC-type phosphate/phosphonate transport system substrate-binding protein